MGGDVRRREGYVCGPCQQPPDPQPMGTATRPAKTVPAPWDAFSDVGAFIDQVLVELAAMAADGTRPTRPGPKPALAGAELRKAVMAIWCVCFCGMQWRVIGELSGIPFGTLFSLFARWTRLGLWRRLLDRLRRSWRLACGDTAEPSTAVIDALLPGIGTARSVTGLGAARRGAVRTERLLFAAAKSLDAFPSWRNPSSPRSSRRPRWLQRKSPPTCRSY